MPFTFQYKYKHRSKIHWKFNKKIENSHTPFASYKQAKQKHVPMYSDVQNCYQTASWWPHTKHTRTLLHVSYAFSISTLYECIIK